jgi:hypothetical protein
MTNDPFVLDRMPPRTQILEGRVYKAPNGRYLKVFMVSLTGEVKCTDLFTKEWVRIGKHEFETVFDFLCGDVPAYVLQTPWQVWVAEWANFWRYWWKQ